MHVKPLKWYEKLATNKGRIESGAFLVEDERAIRQIITVNLERKQAKSPGSRLATWAITICIFR
jgi:hypothetical protein